MHTDDTFWRLSGKLEDGAFEGGLRFPSSQVGQELENLSFAELRFSLLVGGWRTVTYSKSTLLFLGLGREEALTESERMNRSFPGKIPILRTTTFLYEKRKEVKGNEVKKLS